MRAKSLGAGGEEGGARGAQERREKGEEWTSEYGRGVSAGEPPAGLRRGALRAASLPGCVGRGASGGRLAAWRCAPALRAIRTRLDCIFECISFRLFWAP